MSEANGEMSQIVAPQIPEIPKIVIPPGNFEAPTQDNNFHEVVIPQFIINGQPRNIELIHQLRSGDCVLANFLNTYSIEEAINQGVDSKLPMTIQEARQAAIRLRQQAGESADDIRAADSPLAYKDTVRLFSSIHGQAPKQEDVLTVEGRNQTTSQLRLKALNVMEYLDTYPSGLCTTGLGNHSRTIRKLEGDKYAIIDPMNPNGMKLANTALLMDFLASHMQGRAANDNFFFFVRK